MRGSYCPTRSRLNSVNLRAKHHAASPLTGEKVNTLKAEFAAQVRAILKQIRENKALQGVVFISAKADNF
ncbi:hypothetical protein ONJ45_26985, partial [Salmonella enterica subsp. enterica serovar Virginia]|nr:hypothetical protein [Salmonella enterica subsp. enterica serovar Virginia]